VHYENYKGTPNFKATFPIVVMYINFDQKWAGLQFGLFFHKHIWSPWPGGPKEQHKLEVGASHSNNPFFVRKHYSRFWQSEAQIFVHTYVTGQGPMLWFKKYFRHKIWRKNCRFLLKILLVNAKIDSNIGFLEKSQIFRRKLGKIAENCDHNMDPNFVVRQVKKWVISIN
jgi:hypothetical protein